ncbi:hypothetical protein EDC18_101512 [Natranaerovirga pectinivora]|uniref:Uncharacterized protein n=1 Tax=Natranaerovirga pectinivora TaxID=682400 RepID=A0A4R3MR10_9FIRM|nr:hypothetical protein [Natranaerovirga pectinivora]TCT17214.1 hypothetical protein EDC18_101512 [Natranaerovirga pectinivora]
MKKKIVILLIVLLITIGIGFSYLIRNYHKSAFLFSSNSNNTGDSGFKAAEFIEFNGNDYYTLNAENIDLINYQYFLELESGEIKFILYSGTKKIWSNGEIRETIEDSGEVELKNKQKLRLRVIGKNATGKYRFEWEG